ncbi:Clp protease ClpP [Anaerocolumna sp. AGMB13025]|uniref:head maturation protease, ClpP-related n=1 Tax=Anaerocolumna sp. AGMB13025 TaxID=3039116 RepID=UPI00241D757F|nr:head maturation protease, ClpP-related [Anaerocolumna sp. AGMB13025]WFR55365.1 Clp protease ClpP [Anaerocolumna sp. AGMB13025]
MPNKFWNFITNNDNTADLNLYGEIMSEEPWFSEDYVTYKQFVTELNNLGSVDMITVHINSGGGDVFAAHAIFTNLKMNTAKIIAHIEGICASAATIVAAAADVIKSAPNALIMYHNNSVGLYGYYNSDELEKFAEMNRTVKQSIIESYKTKYDKTEEELTTLMDEETWMTGKEAVESGYVDELLFQDISFEMKKGAVFVNNITTKQVTVCNKKEYKNFPTNLLDKTAPADFINKNNKKGISEEMEIKSVDDLKQAYPDYVNLIITDAMSKAVTEERTRLQEIDKLSGGVSEDMLNKAKYTEPISSKDLAYQVMVANSSAGQQFFNGMKDDLNGSGTAAIGADAPPATEEDKKKTKVNNLTGFLIKDKRRKN